jgi:hypothetical protein
MRLLRWLPFRRVELLVTLILLLAALGLSAYVRSEMDPQGAAFIVVIILELILPVGMGLLASGLLAGDPALDIVLSAHRPAWQVLAERLVFIAGVAGLFAWAASALAAYEGLLLPKEGAARGYIWLSPLVFNLGLGSAVSLLRGKMLDGALAVLGGMGASLMLLPLISRQCAARQCAAHAPQAPCMYWLSSPMMTLANPGDLYWPLNRLLWLCVGLGLLALSLRLTQRKERLLHEAAPE